MIDDRNIYRSAKLYIENHGEQAAMTAPKKHLSAAGAADQKARQLGWKGCVQAARSQRRSCAPHSAA